MNGSRKTIFLYGLNKIVECPVLYARHRHLYFIDRGYHDYRHIREFAQYLL